eukprot:scaffold14726_cov146-Skeletonema_menzelii.AAC.3
MQLIKESYIPLKVELLQLAMQLQLSIEVQNLKAREDESYQQKEMATNFPRRDSNPQLSD